MPPTLYHQDMLQDEAQRGAARVRQVEDEMGTMYETLTEREATIKSMQVRIVSKHRMHFLLYCI